MKLHEAVHQSVEQFGKQVIAERRLTNIVNDFNAYKEFPALKKIFPELIKDGYATQIYEDSLKNSSTAIKNARIYATALAKEKSYKDDLVNYCFDSLLYALGLITSITEPTTKGFDPSAKNTDILEDLDEKLADLKKKYLNLLSISIVEPKNLLHEPPAYIPTDAMSALIEVEYKIVAISQQLGTLPLDWCKKEREARLKALNDKRGKQLLPLFNDLRSKYEKTIKENIVIPHFLWVKRSGYISKKGEAELAVMEQDIRLAYSALNRIYDNWCEKEKTAYLNAYKVKRRKFILDIILKILLPAYLLSIIIANIFVAVYFDKPVTKETETVEEQVEQVEEVKDEQKVEEKTELKTAPQAEPEKKTEKKVEQKTEKKEQSKEQKVVQKPEPKGEQSEPSTTTVSKSTTEQKLENNVNKSKSTGETTSKLSAEDKNENKAKKEVKSEDQSAKLEELYNQCTALVDKGNIAEAAILFNNETKGKTYDYSYSNWRYYDTKALITKSLDPWVETLIKQIARNGGRLIPKMKKKVKEVSQIFPDNYWLGVISKRESGNGGTYGQIMVTTMNEAGELVYLLDRVGFAPNPTKIERQNGTIIMTEDIKTALKLFQAYNDLTPNGEPDKNTLKILKSKAK